MSFSLLPTLSLKVLLDSTQLHIYCYTMRFAWDLTFDYLRNSKLGRGPQGTAVSAPPDAVGCTDCVGLSCQLANHSSPHLALPAATVIYLGVNIERFPFLTSKQDFTSPFPGW